MPDMGCERCGQRWSEHNGAACARIAALRQRADAAEARAKEAEERSRQSVCVWCGTVLPRDPDPEKNLLVMWEHAKGCDKRPEHKLAKALEEAEQREQGLRAALRTARIELAAVCTNPEDPVPSTWPDKLNDADRECLSAALRALPRTALAPAT